MWEPRVAQSQKAEDDAIDADLVRLVDARLTGLLMLPQESGGEVRRRVTGNEGMRRGCSKQGAPAKRSLLMRCGSGLDGDMLVTQWRVLHGKEG